MGESSVFLLDDPLPTSRFQGEGTAGLYPGE